MPQVKRWAKGMCPACRSNLADQGWISCNGQSLAMGFGSDGWCGPVRLGSVAVDPVAKKWVNFSKQCLDGKGIARRVSGRWQPLRPDDLNSCDRTVGRRHRLELAGLAVAMCSPCVSNACEFNAAKAALFRLFTAPKHRPVATSFETLSRYTDRLLPGFTMPCEPMSVDEWIESMPSRRRKALRRAALNVNRYGWRKAWLKFKAFVKSEKLPGFEKSPGVGPTELKAMMDRLIQGPADEAHVLLGPHIKPLCARLKSIWHHENHIFYAATNVGKLNSWYRASARPGYVAVMADYSKFDNSHSKLSWDWVEELYRRVGIQAKDERIPKILSAWRKPGGFISGKGWTLRYQADVMNASGRDDTALSNALLNGCAMFLSLTATCRKKKIEQITDDDVAWAEANIRLAVCGDDTLAFVPVSCVDDRFRQGLSDNVASFGFCAEGEKLIISEDPFDHVFLGMRPHPVRGDWWFGKTIGRAVYKMGWRLDPTTEDLAAWFAGECVATLATQRCVPILSDIAEDFLLKHRGKIRSADAKSWKDEEVEGVESPPYDASTVAYIERGYGFPRGVVSSFAKSLISLRYPAVSSHPALTAAILHDDL